MSNVSFSATPEQIEIMQHPAQIKVAVCGRRWGKSIMMAIYLAWASLEWNNCTVWYVSQRYARSLKMMRIMKKCKPFMELVARTCSQFPPRFEMKNGSEIGFVSADRPDDLKGEGLRLICLDEAAIQTRHLYENVLYPMILDSDGTILIGSTYNGRNWFYDLAQKAKTGEDDNLKVWEYATSTGMRFKGASGIERLAKFKKTISPMVWEQECECKPLAQADAVFRYVDQCVIDVTPARFPDPGQRFVLAQDIGRRPDRSGVVVMNLDTGEVVHAECYDLGMEHVKQAQRTKELAALWNHAVICLDTTGGASGGHHESHIREYREILGDIRAITFTIDTKRNMVNRLDLDFETVKVQIPKKFDELITQLKLYKYSMGERAILPQFFGRPDDLCFPAGSMVLTERGEVPIENVSNAMRVLTRNGWQRVMQSGMTGIKKLHRTGNMIGTANHPVFCVNQNMYKRLDALAIDDIVLTWKKREKRELLTELDFIEIEIQNVQGQSSFLREHDSIVRNGQSVNVYNLSVENHNEYFCQGVLVHNCCAMMMCTWARDK